MADNDDEIDALAGLAPEQLSDEIARDIAKRWDPERLMQLVAARAGKGEQLDASLRQRYEQKLGVDLGHVRIYSGEFAEEFNKRRNAEAVTIGGTGMILMGGTADRMGSAAGQALLAHELTHVAQAERGVFRKGMGADSMELATEEHEAEAEAAEHEEMQSQQGGAARPGDGGASSAKAKAKLEEDVVERVIEMIGESMRVLMARSGPAMRRP